MIEALQQEGCEVIAIAPKDEFADLLQAMGCRFVHVPMDNKGANPFGDFLLFIRFWLVYKKIKPDYILHYTIKPNVYGTLAATLLSIPCISNVSGLGTTFIRKGLLLQIVRRLYQFAFLFPKKVFFQNGDDHQLFLNLGLVREQKTGLLPGSGINLSNYAPLMPESYPFRFLLIARLLVDKGIREFASACELLKKKGYVFEAHLVGFFDRASKYNISEEEIGHWQLNNILRFVGESKDVRVNIADAHCVVLPSYREGTPRSLLEAMAMQKPIITTNAPGCKEVLVDGENGFFCMPRDVVSLAEAMEKMLNASPDELGRMGLLGRKMAEEKFDERLVIRKYFEEIFSK